jgi:hypothetical protein
VIGRIAYRLFVVFVFLVGTVVEVSRQRPVQVVDMAMPEAVMPGQVLPPDAACEWQYYRPDEFVYCRVQRRGREVILAYDLEHIAETAYRPTADYNLGQVVLSKGAPVSVIREGDSFLVYWADGTAVYLYTRMLRPTTLVLLVLLGTTPTSGRVHSWRGFANNQK